MSHPTEPDPRDPDRLLPDGLFDPFVPPTDGVEEPAAEAGATGGVMRRLARHRAVRVPAAALGGAAVLATLFLLSTRDQLAQPSPNAPVTTAGIDGGVEGALPLVAFAPDDPYTFRGLDIHPDRLFAAYFGGAFLQASDSAALAESRDFRFRLDMYRKAYGVDDNFTIRVLDERTGETLEVLTLRDLRARYETTGEANWDAVDFPTRRDATTRLRQKWYALGVPRNALTIRWGRANQTFEARERDEPYLEYEVQLARRLGLSLLATEVGTVETFNQDHLVSSAGARSRYQMMPDILAMFDVERYRLSTAGGTTVAVAEELHPLLAMEPAMMLLRAYANAVGHELPGVSAYHTGPGNIFVLYQAYLRAHAANPPLDGHVSDAYMWGVTDGFERVDAQSSFGTESRAYVMKAYGALRATEDQVVNPAGTVRAERVRLREGAVLPLSRMLTALAGADGLAWGPAADDPSLYDRFRALNPHLALPAAGPLARGADVPARGDVRFTARAAGEPVRFFLPPGAADVLRRVGFDVFADVTPFDGQTFLVEPGELTDADRAYDRLVEDIGRFGFSTANKARLDALGSRMQALAVQNPSRYRQTQAKIIRIHQSVWSTRAFRDLAGTAETLLSIVPQRRAQQQIAADSSAGVDG